MILGFFFLPKSTFEDTFRERTLNVCYLKVPSKVDFGQRNHSKLFLRKNFLTENPKIVILGSSFDRNQLLRTLLENEL